MRGKKGPWIPCFQEEAMWMRASRVFPLAVGDVVIRDARVVRGGTPNILDKTHFFPSVQVVSNAFAAFLAKQNEVWPVLPRHIFAMLSPRCQEKCPPKILGTEEGRRLRQKGPFIAQGIRQNFARVGRSWEMTQADFRHASKDGSDSGEKVMTNGSKHAHNGEQVLEKGEK